MRLDPRSIHEAPFDAELTARHVPAAFWPSVVAHWVTRLGSGIRSAPHGLAVATTLVGNELEEHDAAQLLRLPARRAWALRVVRSAGPHAYELKQLCDIAALAQSGHIPIDYERRRAIVSQEPLLRRDDWSRISLLSGMAEGALYGKAVSMVEHLFAGGGIEHARAQRTYDFFQSFTHEAVGRLVLGLEYELLRRGIDEPLFWDPADVETDWVATGNQAWDEVRAGASLAVLARTKYGSVSSIFTRLARAAKNVGGVRAKSKGALPVEVTAQDLVRAYEKGSSLKALAADFELDRKRIRRIIEWNGEIRKAKPPTFVVDRNWLNARLARDPTSVIADEIGCSASSVARIAGDFGLQKRPRGGSSHRSRAIDDSLPTLLGRALRGQGAQQRIERFIQLVQFETVNDAAVAFGLVGEASLLKQLEILERDSGAVLVERSRRHALRLTETGATLARQAARHLRLEYKPPPALAARVLNVLDARRTWQLIELSARRGSVRAAAESLGRDRYAAKNAIRRLEQRCDLSLITFETPSGPCRLTEVGEQVLGQLAQVKWARDPGPRWSKLSQN